jgi:hypothetical protein
MALQKIFMPAGRQYFKACVVLGILSVAVGYKSTLAFAKTKSKQW